MSVKVSRTSEARREENGERRYAPAAGEPDAVEKLLANAYQAASDEGDFERGDDDGRRIAGRVVVTRRTDDSGNPIAYQLMSSDTA